MCVCCLKGDGSEAGAEPRRLGRGAWVWGPEPGARIVSCAAPKPVAVGDSSTGCLFSPLRGAPGEARGTVTGSRVGPDSHSEPTPDLRVSPNLSVNYNTRVNPDFRANPNLRVNPNPRVNPDLGVNPEPKGNSDPRGNPNPRANPNFRSNPDLSVNPTPE